ncbi:hypothetical protein E4656_00045 [Natronospirillum operosum]|uniref:Tetratricopeptide repeat protein n=1 Tax=Natronospirillum operosum TaxID=2759953 RepID=A0A4Z0W8D6_9GAMM|nr:hypothetical protein [Natronospirillum operosum]TGG94859.1 hypothetical protein E4656_00045 [Natronospirillum operosum]
MSTNVVLMDNRQLIPRWHESSNFYRLQYPGVKREKSSKNIDDIWVYDLKARWSTEKNIYSATDLFVALFTRARFDDIKYKEALDFLLRHYDELPPETKELVSKNGDPPFHIDNLNLNYAKIKIKELRRLVNTVPQSSILWVDLAFYYTVLGEVEKARKALIVAWNLGKNSSYVAKAYSRFLVHDREPEHALWVLRKSGFLEIDPSLCSASLSISSAFDIPDITVRKARKVLDGYTGDPIYASDLNAALGSIEFKSGSVKKAKKYFNDALSRPSENVNSQYAWLQYKYGFEVGGYPVVEKLSIEADVNMLYKKMEFKLCRDKLLDLYRFQPFTDAPLVDAGYISMLSLEDPNFVVETSVGRIPLTHMGFGELNNLVVAKLMLEDYSDLGLHLEILKRKCIDGTDADKAVYLATCGMSKIKLGDVGLGEELYEGAINFFSSKGYEKQKALAMYFYAKNIRHYNLEKYNSLMSEALRLAQANRMYELLQ